MASLPGLNKRLTRTPPDPEVYTELGVFYCSALILWRVATYEPLDLLAARLQVTTYCKTDSRWRSPFSKCMTYRCRWLKACAPVFGEAATESIRPFGSSLSLMIFVMAAYRYFPRLLRK